MGQYTPEQIGEAIFGQESSRGAADTSQENYAGARGPMQVTRATFDGMKKSGLIPADYEHANPEHSTAAGHALIKHLYDKFGGAPEAVAAAYYAGEKAVRADGSIVNFRDLKNANAPSTHQYVQQVLGRLGLEDEAVPAAVEQPADRKAQTMQHDKGFRPAKPVNFKGVPSDEPIPTPFVPVGNTSTGPLDDPYYQQQAAGTAQARAEVAKVEGTDFIDRFRQASLYQTLPGFIFRQAVRPEFEPTPGYRVDPKQLAGLDTDEMEDMMHTNSGREAEYRLMEIQARREAMRDIGSGGGFQALAAGLMAGFPEGAVSGMGMARLFALRGVSASQYAAKGMGARAVASSVAENVGGNVLTTGVQAKFDPYTGAADVGMAAILGAAFSAAEVRGLLRTAGVHASLDAEVQRLTKAAAQQRSDIEAEAVRRLGGDATPEALSAEAQRIEADRIRVETERHKGAIADDRMLVTPEVRRELYGDDAMTGEVPKAPTAEAAIGPDQPQRLEFPTIDENFEQPKGAVLLSGEGAAQPYVLSTHAMWSDTQVRDAWAGKSRNTRMMDKRGNDLGTFGTEFARRTGGLELDAAKLDKFAGEQRVAYLGNDIPALHREIIDFAKKNFLGDRSIVVSNIRRDGKMPRNAQGDAAAVWAKVDALRYDPMAPDAVYTLTHELGHLAFNNGMRNLSEPLRNGFLQFHKEWLEAYQGKGNLDPRVVQLTRSTSFNETGTMLNGITNPNGFFASLQDIVSRVVQKFAGDRTFPKTEENLAMSRYYSNADEFGAEQFTKYIQAAFEDQLGWKPKSIPQAMADWLRTHVGFNLKLHEFALEHNLIRPDTRVTQFFDGVRNLASTDDQVARGLTMDADVGSPSLRLHTDEQLASRYGFDGLPNKTPQQRAEFKAVADLYRRASDSSAPWNHPDLTKNLSTLLDTAPMKGAQSVSATMLRSENPVMRMLAAELLESPSGAGGRRSTASIAKWMNEQKYMGRSILEVQDAYRIWRRDQGGTVIGDVFDGKLWQQFNRKVAEEIENRRWGRAAESHESVKGAADSVEAAYERMRIDQITTKTIGWAGLPSTSVGYMPHRMSASRVRNLNEDERFVLRQALREQFQEIEGFDAKFSADLANSYLERVRERAVGEIDPAIGIHQVGAADMVEDALKAMGLKQEEVRAMMQKYMRGAPGYTKRRLTLDLTKPYETPNGTFNLMDVFATDQLQLLRTQARRVSGETALVRHGIMGKPGMNLMRRAVGFGTEGSKAQNHELQAFDQMAAEFFGDRFGTQGGKWMDRALQFTSLTRLGGMGFTQLAESINMIAHVGVVRALSSIGSLNRLRSEALALSRGERVDNSILKSLEQFGGAEFGTENRKMIFPFDNPELQYQTFGHDTEYAADRLLRGGVHLQGKLSMWQAIHGAQQRGAAEQIVRKAFEYIRENQADKALDDMGINEGLRAMIRDELPNVAQFDGAGRLIGLDITKMENKEAAENFVQAVHRGAAQIIQGTFIGERGAWAHDAQMKILTQFRTFSLTAIEKQWARQVGIGGGGLSGHARAAGILMGAMSFAAPIYIARTYIQSIGRSDQSAYLEKRLDPLQIARATMNYVGLTGLAGDFLDVGSQVTGLGTTTGGRTGHERDFFGDTIAPAVGVANDLYKAVQNTKEGTDPTKLMKTLPFSNLPYVMPVVSSMGQ